MKVHLLEGGPPSSKTSGRTDIGKPGVGSGRGRDYDLALKSQNRTITDAEWKELLAIMGYTDEDLKKWGATNYRNITMVNGLKFDWERKQNQALFDQQVADYIQHNQNSTHVIPDSTYAGTPSPLTDPEFHGTLKEHLDSILKKGIKPAGGDIVPVYNTDYLYEKNEGDDRSNRVFVTPSFDSAVEAAKQAYYTFGKNSHHSKFDAPLPPDASFGNMIIFETRLPEKALEMDTQWSPGYMVKGGIKPKNITGYYLYDQTSRSWVRNQLQEAVRAGVFFVPVIIQ